MLFKEGYWYTEQRFNKGEAIAWVKYKFTRPILINGFALENVGENGWRDPMDFRFFAKQDAVPYLNSDGIMIVFD